MFSPIRLGGTPIGEMKEKENKSGFKGITYWYYYA